ncbi:hypothetical protein ISU07_13075 [Nocardioides islandensis]|uniref:Uncharacterized protein n=1 Tax=Nocardioides islandensis TaxID=433663 RepID=A0A930VGC0_9ACTN|nr:hypothetical protein [Nocardioides islandensis]MBF4764061.1 hypothetical protein [Nocardioides islandensis]
MNRLTSTVLAGLLVGAGLTACGDEASSADGGDVVVGHLSDKVQGDAAFVLLPTGRIDLTVGAPVDEVTADQAGDGKKHSAPDGGAFVPVTWSHDPFGEGGVPIGVIGADPQEADVVLVSGDTRADLGAPYRLAGDQGTTDTGVGTMYVAVDGDGRSATFEVSYDGLTQTVDPATGDRAAGAAAPLYADRTVGVEAPCTQEGFAHGDVVPDVSCVVDAPVRTPYLPGHGWAADGDTWLLLGIDITISGVRVGATSYDVQSVRHRITVNGADAVEVDERSGDSEPLPSAVRGTWVFDGGTGADTLDITLDLVLEKKSGPGPSTRQETVQQEVALGDG